MSEPDAPDDDDALAAEYVLHLLDATERQRFEQRLRAEPDLRALVHSWEARLASLAENLPDAAPSAGLKAAILAKVAPGTEPEKYGRNWRFGIFGLAAAAALAVFMFAPLLRPPVDISPAFQADLQSSDGALVLVAGVIPATHEIVIERLAGQAPEGRVLELWLIAEGAAAPVSLGLLDADTVTRIRVPDDIAPGVRTGTIAISEEPPGGSPTGAPTGQVLATGTFVDL